MNAENFCYWLKGYFEILAPALNSSTLSEAQVKVIQTHLDYVFAPKNATAVTKSALDAIKDIQAPMSGIVC